MRRFILSLLMLCCALVAFANPQKETQKTFEYRLDNGLKLIVRVDHRAPVVLSSIWYKVGSSYEHSGITGLSHMLEHMMFRGTPTVSGPELDKIVASNGGQQNATTTEDFTMYYQILPADRLPVSFRLEADRMRNLILDENIFLKENKVVREERRMRTDDSPQGMMAERFTATAHVNNPYHNPTVGWMTDLESMKIQDLRKWYEKWYAPNNAVLIVVGDVKPLEVLSLARQYFGAIKPSEITPPKPRTEIPSIGVRHVNVQVPAKTPWLVMGYNVPTLKTAERRADAYALELLTGILSGGNSSRLAKNLVRSQQVAVEADASYSLYHLYSDLFTFSAIPAPNRTVQELQQAIINEITQLQTTLVPVAELNRVKAQIIASKVYDKDSLMTQGNDLGTPEMAGLSWRDSDAYVEHINAVTPEQIRDVVRKYFIPNNLTIGILQPQATEGFKPMGPTPPQAAPLRRSV